MDADSARYWKARAGRLEQDRSDAWKEIDRLRAVVNEPDTVFLLYSFCTDEQPKIHAAAATEATLQAYASEEINEAPEPLSWERGEGGGLHAQLTADGFCWLHIVPVEVVG